MCVSVGRGSHEEIVGCVLCDQVGESCAHVVCRGCVLVWVCCSVCISRVYRECGSWQQGWVSVGRYLSVYLCGVVWAVAGVVLPYTGVCVGLVRIGCAWLWCGVGQG